MYTLSDKKLIMLRPKDIKPSSAVPRREFDEYELKLLTDSIQASGIIEPLAVRRLQGGGYALITAVRRCSEQNNILRTFRTLCARAFAAAGGKAAGGA